MFLHLALLAASAAREIKVVNNCSQELWLGASNLILKDLQLQPKQQLSLEADGLGSAKLWARTCSEVEVFQDCWKDLGLDAPCGTGTYYYCRDDWGNQDLDSAMGRCQSKGPIAHCQHQCVITHSLQEDKFLTFLSAQETPVEARSRKHFHCSTGDGVLDQVSQQQCTERTKLASPATMAEFHFGTETYDVSVVQGFNVNISIVPSSSSCPSTQCKMNPWWQCQPEFLDLAQDHSFCWSMATAVTSPAVLGRYPFLAPFTAPGSNREASKCLVQGQEVWCNELITCGNAPCQSQAELANGSFACAPHASYDNRALWPFGPPYKYMCNVTNWPKSPLDQDSYISKYEKACPDAKTFPFQQDVVKQCKSADYTVTFCP